MTALTSAPIGNAPTQPGARAWSGLLAAAALAICLGAALPPMLPPLGPVFTRLAEAARATLAADPGPAPAAREWAPRPLPREWRWSPPGVDVSGMFRRPQRAR